MANLLILLLHEEWNICLMTCCITLPAFEGLIWSDTCPMCVFRDVCFWSNQSKCLASWSFVSRDAWGLGLLWNPCQAPYMLPS
jgi:hypothetical protein